MMTGPLLLDPASLPEPPQPLSSMANDNAAAARASAFFFIDFSYSVVCKDAEAFPLHAKRPHTAHLSADRIPFLYSCR
jgi:hypothetical protein